MEQNNKSKLITLLCLILTAVLLEGLLIWAITPHGGNSDMEDLDDLGCMTEEDDYYEPAGTSSPLRDQQELVPDANDEAMLTTDSGPISYDIMSTRRLTEEDIAYKTKEELRIARNEIYARHGYIFKSNDLKEYFGAKNWYQPVSSDASQFNMNEYEQYNVDFIKKHE